MLSKNTPELDSNGDEVYLFVVSTLAPRLPVILGPNITGSVKSLMSPTSEAWSASSYTSGAFTAGNVKKLSTDIVSGISDTEFDLSFIASLSSSIYGNSTTVQPLSLIFNYIIKY